MRLAAGRCRREETRPLIVTKFGPRARRQFVSGGLRCCPGASLEVQRFGGRRWLGDEDDESG